MTVATDLMRHAQWALLNHIHQCTGGPQARALVLIAAADACNSDVFDLEEAGMVVATVYGEPISAKLALTTFDMPAKTRLRLTKSGINWVQNNPRNKVLAALAERPNHQAPVSVIACETDVDPAVLFALEDAGLIHTTCGDGGNPVRLTIQLLRAPGEFVKAQLTNTGRRLAGV